MVTTAVRRTAILTTSAALVLSGISLAVGPAGAAARHPAAPAKAKYLSSFLSGVAVAPHSKVGFAFGSHNTAAGSSIYALRGKGSHWKSVAFKQSTGGDLHGHRRRCAELGLGGGIPLHRDEQRALYRAFDRWRLQTDQDLARCRVGDRRVGVVEVQRLDRRYDVDLHRVRGEVERQEVGQGQDALDGRPDAVTGERVEPEERLDPGQFDRRTRGWSLERPQVQVHLRPVPHWGAADRPSRRPEPRTPG